MPNDIIINVLCFQSPPSLFPLPSLSLSLPPFLHLLLLFSYVSFRSLSFFMRPLMLSMAALIAAPERKRGEEGRGRGEGEECVLQLILISVGRSPLGLVIMTCKYKMPCQAVPRRLLRMQRMYLRIVGFSCCCCCCTVEVVVVAAAAELSLLWFCLRITSINFAGLICVLLPVALPAPHRSREALQANRAPRRPFVYAFSSSFIIFLLLFLLPLPTASATATCKRQQHHEKCIFNSRRDNVEDVVEKRHQQQQ